MTDRELMQQALDCLLAWEEESSGYGWSISDQECVEALRARLAQPEPEPVAWEPKIERLYDKNGFLLHQKIKRTPSSEWEDYYPEPQRKWQGLTEYEVGFLTVFDGLYDVEAPLLANFIRHIEAKLKEKNSG